MEQKMAEINEKELKEGKRQLEGVLILCWVMAILTGLAIFSGFNWGWGPIGFITHYIDEPFTMFALIIGARVPARIQATPKIIPLKRASEDITAEFPLNIMAVTVPRKAKTLTASQACLTHAATRGSR